MAFSNAYKNQKSALKDLKGICKKKPKEISEGKSHPCRFTKMPPKVY
jgi:hypothetical protein